MTIQMFSTYLFSFLITITLILHVSRKENKYKGSYDYYRSVIISTGFLTLLEMLSWIFEGRPGSIAYTLNVILNYLLLYSSALPITLWFIYFDYWTCNSTSTIYNKRVFYFLINFLIFVLVTINIFHPILFYIDEGNNFVGTNGTIIVGLIQLIFLTSYLIYAFRNRSEIRDSVFKTIVLLYFLPIPGVLIQATHIGSVYIWPIMTYVAFCAFLLIEREEMSKDPLTNLLLRRHLESRIIHKLKRNQAFTLIMIDLDDFKLINDNHGHQEGDYVLRDFANILISSIPKVDTAYRYAGDEFIILLTSIDFPRTNKLIATINKEICKYNSNSKLDYVLSMSYGILEVNQNKHLGLQDIFSIVDKKMYYNKSQKKQGLNTQTKY